MSKPIIVGLTGRKFAGKDFLAKTLIDEGYLRVSFSDSLKRLAQIAFPWIEADYDSEDKEKVIAHPKNSLQKSPRQIWKTLDVLRTDVDPRIFVDSTMEEILDARAEGKNIVITDIRKPEEYNLVKALGGFIIRITDPNQTNQDVSEWLINDFKVDVEFDNFKTVDSVDHFREMLRDNRLI